MMMIVRKNTEGDEWGVCKSTTEIGPGMSFLLGSVKFAWKVWDGVTWSYCKFGI